MTGPQTWDEFEEFAKKMTDTANGVFGAALCWDTDAWIWESMLYSNGGEIISDDNKTILFNKTSTASDIIARMQRMAKAGTLFNPYISQGNPWGTLGSKFAEGKVDLFVATNGVFSSMTALAKETGFEIALALQPKKDKYSASTGGGNIILFNSAPEEKKQAAGKFIEYLAKDEYVAEYSKLSGYLPVTKSSLNHTVLKEMLEATPAYQVVIDQMQYAHRRPMTKNWKNIYSIVVDELETCMTYPDTDPVAAMKTAETASQKIVDENP